MQKLLTGVNRYLYWAPRILGVLFVLFLILFSLDVFQPGVPPAQIAVGLFMHNIPALFLSLILAFSWKHEVVGGVFFILAGLLYVLLLASSQNFEWYMTAWVLVISGPAFLVGVLFLLSRSKNK